MAIETYGPKSTPRGDVVQALAEFIVEYEAEHGEITKDEMAAARRRLRARAGRERQNDELASRTRDINDLFGVLHRPGVRALTIEEINEGIAEGAAESGMRGWGTDSSEGSANNDPPEGARPALRDDSPRRHPH